MCGCIAFIVKTNITFLTVKRKKNSVQTTIDNNLFDKHLRARAKHNIYKRRYRIEIQQHMTSFKQRMHTTELLQQQESTKLNWLNENWESIYPQSIATLSVCFTCCCCCYLVLLWCLVAYRTLLWCVRTTGSALLLHITFGEEKQMNAKTFA